MMDVAVVGAYLLGRLADPINLTIAALVIFVAYKWVRWVIRAPAK